MGKTAGISYRRRTSGGNMKQELAALAGQALVVDTASNWIFIGTLDRISDNTLVLREADAHDITDTEATKERYIFDARTQGIKANRSRVHIALNTVVSFSLLSDVNSF